MRIDLAGKIRNTQLLRYRPLLPMFEAVVNSFQAIEDAYASGVTVNPRIDIKVRRDGVLPDLGVQGKVDGFTISYFGYNLGLSAYVEIISYAKLLQDAKKRNRILFDKLNLPLHST